jgi:hypothetical protein
VVHEAVDIARDGLDLRSERVLLDRRGRESEADVGVVGVGLAGTMRSAGAYAPFKTVVRDCDARMPTVSQSSLISTLPSATASRVMKP